MRHKKIFGIIVIITLIFISWALSSLFQDPAKNEHAQDLGSELQYAGASITGCDLCVSGKTVTYYFGTSLTEEGLKEYFRKAVLRDKNTSDENTDLTLRFNEEYFTIHYSAKIREIVKKYSLKDTGRPYLVWFNKSVYSTVQQAL